MEGLLAEKLAYYEDPCEPPITEIAGVLDVWADIKEQAIEYVEIRVLHEDKNVAVAQWRFKQVGQPEHVGSYFVRLDERGKCIEFRQWWNCRSAS